MDTGNGAGDGLMASKKNRRLVLHFDINNTILMKDAALGVKSVQENIQHVIAKSAWGRLTPAPETAQTDVPNWHLAYDQLSWRKPEYVQVKDKETGELVSVEVISYMSYLDQYYPTKDHENAEQNKLIRADRLSSFARPGGLGHKFKNYYEKMLKCMMLPKGAKEELDFGPEIVEKVLKGEPLWPEEKEKQDDEDDDAEQNPDD